MDKKAIKQKKIDSDMRKIVHANNSKQKINNFIIKMTEKSLQMLQFQFNSPIETSIISSQNNPERQVEMKAEQHNDIGQKKICNEQSFADPNSLVSKKEWTPEEDELVYKLHNEYGNKWAIIAEQLKGRSDNCIKNHFYSRLRKGLRKINKVIEDLHSKQFKEFKIIDLYKIIEASDEKFKEFNSYPNEMTDFGHDLKNRLFIFAEEESDGTQQFEIKSKKILEDMNDFTKNYKRKSKKQRRYSPMGVGSVYRNNKKQQNQQSTEHGDMQIENSGIESKQKVKIQTVVKVEQDLLKKQRKPKSKKQIQKLTQNLKSTEPSLQIVGPVASVPKKQAAKQISLPELLQVIEDPLNKAKSRKTYRQFSDDEGEEKDDAEFFKEQRLNNFAQNILKTFKSYYSFKSFKSNSIMDDFIFQ